MSKQTDLINIPDAITVSGSNVGIGTTSPSAKLDIQQATAGNIVSAEFDNTDYTANNRNAIKIRQQNAANSSFSTFLGNDRATGNVFLSNDSITADHLVIDSSGNVGIGTTSITSFSNIPNLTVGGSSGGMLTNQVNGTDGMRLYSNSSGTVLNETRNLFLQFATNNTERMRIDSSGNLLVGKTSTGGNVAGHQFNSNGAGYITRDGASVLHVNRKTSDGEIISIRKNDVAVGSIGVQSTDQLYIATPDGSGVGLIFDGDNRKIDPTDGAGSNLDNAVDLGTGAYRFKDLYLSGGVYLGGTAAANKLDDYEEGTFTPTVTVGTLGDAAGAYTKIGDTVIVYMYMGAFSNRSSGSILTINNLPFTSANGLANGAGGSIFSRYCNKLPNATYVSNNSTNVEMYESATGNYDTVKHDDLSSVSAYFFIQIIYKTS
jgi:hypothetical protein